MKKKGHMQVRFTNFLFFGPTMKLLTLTGDPSIWSFIEKPIQFGFLWSNPRLSNLMISRNFCTADESGPFILKEKTCYFSQKINVKLIIPCSCNTSHLHGNSWLLIFHFRDAKKFKAIIYKTTCENSILKKCTFLGT